MYEEIFDDIVDRVQTPTPPLPDMNDPEVFKNQFELKNLKYKLWYTPHIMSRFKSLRRMIYDRLEI